jgi:hypothetical protein
VCPQDIPWKVRILNLDDPPPSPDEPRPSENAPADINPAARKPLTGPDIRRERISSATKSLRLRTVVCSLGVMCGILLKVAGQIFLSTASFYPPLYDRLSQQLTLLSALLITGRLFGYFLLNYLQFGEFYVRQSSIPTLIGSHDITPYVSSRPLSHDNVYTISNVVLSNANEDVFSVPALSDQLARQLSSMTERLNQEIRALGRRGNVNLFIGIFTTFLGVCVLGFVVFAEGDVDPSNHWRYVTHFVMRISIALFIEVFAYFFLRLYKSCLEDIKYYQNEITNVEARWSALLAAEQNKSQTLLKLVVDALTKTERNFVLKKGDTTVGLERERMEKNEILDLVKETIGSFQRTVRRR